jgi:hypothetical protein
MASFAKNSLKKILLEYSSFKKYNKVSSSKNIFKNIGYIKYDLLKNTNTDEFKTDK